MTYLDSDEACYPALVEELGLAGSVAEVAPGFPL